MSDTEHDRKHLIQQLTPEQRWQEWESFLLLTGETACKSFILRCQLHLVKNIDIQHIRNKSKYMISQTFLKFIKLNNFHKNDIHSIVSHADI